MPKPRVGRLRERWIIKAATNSVNADFENVPTPSTVATVSGNSEPASSYTGRIAETIRATTERVLRIRDNSDLDGLGGGRALRDSDYLVDEDGNEWAIDGIDRHRRERMLTVYIKRTATVS